MGTTPFKAVPYALQAENANNVEGLEKLNIGWRLIGKDPNNYGNVGVSAIDLSTNTSASTTAGATGAYAVATGFGTTASGIYALASGSGSTASGSTSTAMGFSTTASGDNAFALGSYTQAGGEYAMGLGYEAQALGDQTFAFGRGAISRSFRETTLGSFNTEYVPVDTENWVATDRLFGIGNGTQFSDTSDALIILKNGTITAPSFDIAEITDDKALITKEYLDTNAFSGDYNDLTNLPMITEPSGLEALDEGNGIGWRLKNRNPDNYGNVGENAIDLSVSSFASTTHGATGYASTAAGLDTSAPSTYETAIGSKNTLYTPNSTQFNFWSPLDRLFSIGNGFVVRSDALIILKNGTITAPSFDLNEITDNKALTTKEYVDANTASGLEALNEGNGVGWRLKGSNPNSYGNIGQSAIDFSLSNSPSSTRGATGNSSISMGFNTTSSGSYSSALGYETAASGLYSTAIGSNTVASNNSSTAMGRNTEASGDYSTAMGNNTEAFGQNSTAMGYNTVANSFNQTTVGSFNTFGINNSNSWVPTDPIFVVGNGQSTSTRSNALTILKNGHVGIGSFSSSTAKLAVFALGNTGLHLFTNAAINRPHIRIMEQASNSGARIDFVNNLETNNRWTQFVRTDNTHTDSQFNIFYSGLTQNVMSLRGDGNVYINGSLAHSSDRRLKTNIKDLPYGLNEILQLEPKAYFWKDKPEQEQASLGLIAQDAQKVIANIVHINNDDDKTLSLSYTELIPVLINAIKEQQKIIESQKISLKAEKDINTNQNEQFEALLKRVEAIESKQSN